MANRHALPRPPAWHAPPPPPPVPLPPIKRRWGEALPPMHVRTVHRVDESEEDDEDALVLLAGAEDEDAIRAAPRCRHCHRPAIIGVCALLCQREFCGPAPCADPHCHYRHRANVGSSVHLSVPLGTGVVLLKARLCRKYAPGDRYIEATVSGNDAHHWMTGDLPEPVVRLPDGAIRVPTAWVRKGSTKIV